jgi:hypothetical protein
LNRLFCLSLGVACGAFFGPWFVVNLEPIPSASPESEANVLNYTSKKILFTVLVAVAVVVILRMFGLLQNVPAVLR